MKSRYKHEIPLDLHSDEAARAIELTTPLGKGPMEPEPIKRQPYDELYVKLRYDRDYFRE